jgi:hypothetical protein
MILKTSKKKSEDCTERYSTTGVPKFSDNGSIVGLNAQLLKGSISNVTPFSKL